MVRHFINGLVIAAGFAAPAFACATATDVSGGGVLLTDVEGTTMLHRKSGDVARVDIRFTDGYSILETRIHGLYLSEWQEGEDGVMTDDTTEIAFDGGRDALPKPTPGTVIETASVLTAGSVETNWSSTITFGAEISKTYGDCTFAIFPVRFEMQGPLDPVQVEDYLYFPEFGIAHLESSGVGSLEYDTQLISLEPVE